MFVAEERQGRHAAIRQEQQAQRMLTYDAPGDRGIGRCKHGWSVHAHGQVPLGGS